MTVIRFYDLLLIFSLIFSLDQGIFWKIKKIHEAQDFMYNETKMPHPVSKVAQRETSFLAEEKMK